MISAEERHANKEKARRLYEEAFGGGNAQVIDELLHSEFVCHLMYTTPPHLPKDINKKRAAGE